MKLFSHWQRIILVLVVAIALFAGVAFALNFYNQGKLQAWSLPNLWRTLLTFDQRQQSTRTAATREATGSATAEAPSSSSIPSLTATPTPAPVDPYAHDPDLRDVPWGQAVQVSETGWRMKVGFDEQMGTPQETFQALNHYRYTKGKSNLTWDDRLARYALERATFICQHGSDSHEGFKRYVSEEEGYKTLGFYWLGENMSTHMRLSGTHLIEWMYAADPDHDGNQLGDWSHVGVGIFEDCSAVIFGNLMI